MIRESEIENSNANIILEARNSIATVNNFGGDDSLTISDNRDLTLRTRNQVGDGAGSIDLTGSSDGDNLRIRTEGAGSITIEASTDGGAAGNIVLPRVLTEDQNITITTNNGTITFNNTVDAGTGNLTLSATGAVTQTDEITAAGLELLGSGQYTLTNASNDVATIAANTSNTISYTDTDGLTIGTVGGAAGINTGGNDLTLNTGDAITIGSGGGQDITAAAATVTLNPTAGGISQSAGSIITAESLLATGAGAFTFDQTNAVGALAANINGALIFTDTDALTIGTVAATNGVNTAGNAVTLNTGNTLTIGDGGGQDITAAGSTVTLNPTTGGASQGAGSIITADSVLATGAGAFTLDQSNAISTLAANINGDLTFTDTDALTIGTVGATNGINTAGNAATINTGNALTIGDGGGQDITAAGSTVTLNPTAGGVTEGAGSIITADSLAATGAGAFTLDQTNAVATIAANINGALTYTDTDALALSTVGGVNGINTNGNSVTLNTGNALTIINGWDITAAGSTVTLNPTAGGVSEFVGSIITTGNLLLTGAGNFSLIRVNDVDTLAANINGALNYSDINALTIGTVAGTNGINTAGNDVTLNTGNALAIGDGAGQDITAATATVNVNTTTGGVTQAAGSTITADNLRATGAGNFTLDQDNAVGAIAADLNGALALTDTDTLTVGTVGFTNGINTTGNAVTLNTGDALTIGDGAGQDITAAGSTVTLNPIAGGISQGAGSTITAGSLLATGAGAFIFDQINAVDTLAANINGALTYNDTDALTIGTVAATNGINTAGNTVTLNTGDTLTIGDGAGQDITAAADDVTLNITAGGASEAAGSVITADNLLITATGAVTLNQSNVATTLAADVTGSLTYNDTDGLTIGTIGATNGITTTAGLTLTAAGLVSVSDSITTADTTTINTGAGDLTVANTKIINTQGTALNITTNDMTLDGALNSGAGLTTITDFNGPGIGLGAAAVVAGGLNLTDAELDKITATGGLTFITPGYINADTVSSNHNVTLDAVGAITFDTAASSFAALDAQANTGIAVNVDLTTTTGNLSLDGDADNSAGGGDTVAFNTGRVLDSAGSITLDATTTGNGITGAVLTLNANDGVTINNNLATSGDLTIDADQDAGDNNGTLTVATGATVSTGANILDITADDIALAGAGALSSTSGAINITVSDNGTIGLGATAGGLTISGAELQNIATTTGDLTLAGSNSTTTVNGISPANSNNIGGTVIIDATNNPASAITFTGADSTFNKLTATASDTITIDDVAVITDVGDLSLTGDLAFLNAPTLTTATSLTLGGTMTIGGSLALNANDHLTINANAVMNGAFTAVADVNNDNTGTFTLGPGVTLNTNNNNISITADDIDIAATAAMTAGAGAVTLAPRTTSSMGLGDTAAGDFNISTTELSRITTSNTLTIGGAAATATEVDGFNTPATVTGDLAIIATHAAAGQITFQDNPTSTTAGASGLTLTATDGVILNDDLTTAGATTINADQAPLGTGGLTVDNGVTLNTSGNTLSITADDITLTGASALTSVGSTITITDSDNTGIGLGTAAIGLDLAGTELDSITASTLILNTNGPAEIKSTLAADFANIGALDLTVGDTLLFNNPAIGANLTVTAGDNITQSTGPLTVTGNADFTTNVAAKHITLNRTDNAISGSVSLNTLGGGDATFDNGITTLDLAASNVGRNLTVIAGDDITQSGALTVGGTLDVTTDIDDKSITLNDPGNAIAGAVFFATQSSGLNNGDVTFDNGALGVNLNALTVPGDLSITAGDAITQTGALTVAGAASFTTDQNDKAIDLNDFANDITGPVTFATQTAGGNTAHVWFDNGARALALNTSTVRGNLDITNGNNITHTGQLTVAGNGVFTTDLADFIIDLDDFGNNIAGSLTFNTLGTTNSHVTFDNGITAVDLNTSSIKGDLTVTSGEAITQTGALTIAGDAAFTTDVANKAITLNRTDNAITGSVSVNTIGAGDAAIDSGNTALDLAASNVGRNLTITSGDNITQSGALTVGGTATLTTDQDDKTIDLNDFANDITGSVTFNTQTAGGNTAHVWFDNGTRALTINTSTVAGNIDINNGNNITQAGKLTVAGTAIFNIDLADFIIDLDDFENDIDGPLAFTTQGTTNSHVTFDNGATAAILNTSSIKGDLTVISGEAITQSGALTVAGDAAFTTDVADKSITLNRTDNAISGSVSLNTLGIGDATIDNGITALDLAASNVGRNLTVIAGDGITQSGALTVGGTLNATTDTDDKSITLNNPGNAVTGAAFFTTQSSGLNNGHVTFDNGALAVNLNALTIPGDLSIISGDTITQTGALTIAGDAAFTTDVANKAITLNRTDNAITGSVSVNTLGDADATFDSGNTALDLAASNVGRNLTITAGDNTTHSGAITVGGAASFTTDQNDKTIDLNDFANDITGSVTFDTQTAGGNTAHVWFDNGARALTINTSTVAGNIDINNGNNITQAGKLTVAGTAIFNIDLADFIIDLDDFENDIDGPLAFTTQGTTNSHVTFDNGATAAILNTSSIKGDLTVTSGEAITQTGALTVAGDAAFTTDVADKSITLNRTDNAISGSVSLNTLGTGDATFDNGNTALDLAASNVARNLTVIAGDNITQSGALTVGGTLDVTTDNNDKSIDLNDFVNNIAGQFTFATQTAGGNAGHVWMDNGPTAIDLGASTVAGQLTLTGNNGATVNGNVTSAGATLLNGDSGNDGAGSLTIADGATVNTTGGALTITAADLALFHTTADNIVAGATTINATNNRSIGLGATPGDMTITGAELANITAANLTLNSGSSITVNGIAEAQSQGVSATTLDAANSINFNTAASTFNALNAQADDGIVVDVDLTTDTGNLALEGNADNAGIGNNDIQFAADVQLLSSAASITLDATTGNMTAAGDLTVNADQGLTINDSLTTAGTATIDADIAAAGDGDLTIAPAATLSTTNNAANITANDIILAGNLNTGAAPTSITVSDDGDLVLGDGLGDMTISPAELQRITATGLSLITGGSIIVNNISALNSNNIAAITTLDAGTNISFTGTSSTFNTLNAQADAAMTISVGLATDTGAMTLSADQDADGDGALTVGAAVTTAGNPLSITANDITLTGTLNSGPAPTTITDSDGTGIGLGDTPLLNGLNLTGAELQNITATGLELATAGPITIDNITAVNSDNIATVLTLDSAATVTFTGGPAIFNSLDVQADNGININGDLTTDTGNLLLDGDTNIAADGSDGIAFADGVTVTSPTALTLATTNGSLSGAGALTLNADDAITLNGSMTTAGTTNLNSDTGNDGVGTLTIADGVKLDTTAGDLNITAADIELLHTTDDNIDAGATTITATNNRSIGLGATAGDMTITGAELANITATSLTLVTGSTATINGVNSAQSDGVAGILTIDATDTITFATAASTFNAVDAQSDDRIAVNVDITTDTGNLALDGDADNAADVFDDIQFADPTTLTSAGAIILNATTGKINAAGALDLLADNGITLNDDLTTAGATTISADADIDGVGHLTVGVGANIDTGNNPLDITASTIGFAGGSGIANVTDLALTATTGDMDINGGFNNDGALSLTATAGAIILNGPLTTTGAMSLAADTGITVNANLTAAGDTTIYADLNDDGDGDMSLTLGNTITSGNNLITITANDMDIAGNLDSGSANTIAESQGSGIGLGATSIGGGLNLSSAELQNIAAADLLLYTAGSIIVDGIASADTTGISGLVTLNAGADIIFSRNGSTFSTLMALSGGVTQINVDLTTDTGELILGQNNVASSLSFADGVTVTSATSLTLGTATGIMTGDGDLTLAATDGITLNSSLTTAGAVTIQADSENNGAGAFTLVDNVTLDTTGAALDITAADLQVLHTTDDNINAGPVTIIATNGRSIALGDTIGDMTISGAELANITAANLTLATAANAAVSGITQNQSDGIAGPLTIDAAGNIVFDTAPSTFNALDAQANNGILVNVDITTDTASLALDGDADDIPSSSDSIQFAADLGLTSAAAITLDAASGKINAAGPLALLATDGISLNDDLTAAGATTINADTDTSGAGTLTVADSATLATADNPLNITADDIDLLGRLNSGAAATTITVADGGPIALGAAAEGMILSADELANITAADLFLNTTGAAAIDTVTIYSNLSLVAGDAISQSGPLTVTENAAFTTTLDDRTITLDHPANAIQGIVSFTTNSTSANNAHVTLNNGSVPVDLGPSNIAGDLIVSNAETINQSGPLVVAANADFMTSTPDKDITLDSPTNAIRGSVAFHTSGNGNVSLNNNASPIDFLAGNVGGSLTVVTSAAITDSGPLTVQGATSLKTLNDTGSPITLDETASIFSLVTAQTRNADDTADADATITILDNSRLDLGLVRTAGVAHFTGLGISITEALNTQGATFDAGANNFTNAAAISAGAGDIIITADAVALNAPITGDGDLTLQPATTGLPIFIADEFADGFSISAQEVDLLTDGFSSITIGREQQGGSATVDAITFNDPVIIRAAHNETITVNGLITGADNASITLDAPGGATLNADITTAGNDIVIAGPVDADQRHITLNAGDTGNVDLQDDVGNNTLVAGLGVTGRDITLHNVTTTGPQNYNASRTITVNSTYESTVAGDIAYNGDVLLNDDLLARAYDGDVIFAGAVQGGHDLIVDTPSGNIVFGGDMGTFTPLTYLEAITGAAGTIEFNSTINVDGDVLISAYLDIENVPQAATIYKQSQGDLIFNVTGTFQMLQNNKLTVTDGSLHITTTTGDIILGDLTVAGDIDIDAAGDIVFLRRPSGPVYIADSEGELTLKNDSGLCVVARGPIVLQGNVYAQGEGADPRFASINPDLNRGAEDFRNYRLKDFSPLIGVNDDGDVVVLVIPIIDAGNLDAISLLAGIVPRRLTNISSLPPAQTAFGQPSLARYSPARWDLLMEDLRMAWLASYDDLFLRIADDSQIKSY